jgi:hypothetical protein
MARNPSAQFLSELKTNHKVCAKVEVLSGSTVVLSTETETDLYVESGTVDMDRNAQFRRQLTLSLADPKRKYLPISGSSYFHPLGPYELKVYRGIELTTGVKEMFSHGVFGIADLEIEDGTDGSALMKIVGYDKSRKIRRAKLVRPYTIAQNTNTVTAIRDLITFAMTTAPTFLATSTSYTTNFNRLEVETDPWDTVTELAESIGFEVFFNSDGACVIQPIPNPAGGVVSYSYHEGVDAIFGKITKSLSDEEAYNGVLAYGQSTYNITPAFGEAWDTDPSSPTYSGYNAGTGTFGPSTYGRYPKFLQPNINIKLTAQATAAAAAELLKIKGTPENIEFSGAVNPIHEESDLISIKRAAIGVDAIYILDQFSMPLTASGGMTARTRERRD